MVNSAEVKFQEHFKLNVLFKDYILFENLLLENNIDFYHSNNENSDISDGTLFFLLDKDRVIIDKLLISTIFIPLTFIVGIYGMNFDNMPELHWHNGYFIIWGIMIFITICMFIYFRRKRWL